MKQINTKLRNAILSLVMTLIICLAVLYLYTNKSLLEGLIGASPKEIMNEFKIQLALMLIVCSGVGLLLLNTK